MRKIGKMLAPAALAGMLLLILVPTAEAFQAGLKAGYHFYPDSDYFDFLKSDVGIDTGELDGPTIEAFVDFDLLPLISMELGVGGTLSETDIPASGADLEVAGTYVLLTGKVHVLPVSDFDIYAGLGVGWYALTQDVKAGDLTFTLADEGAGGFHGVVGVGYNVTPNLFLLLEGRWARAIIEDVDSLGHDFDVGGAYAQIGVAVTW